jgi:hypothetical protein
MAVAAASLPARRPHWSDHRLQRFAVPAAAGSAVLVGSLLNFLNYNDYPLLTPEVAIALGALVAAACLLAVAHRFAGRLGRYLMDIALLYLALDLNLDLGIAAGLGAVAAAILLNRYLLPGLALIFAVIIMTEALDLDFSGESAAAQASLPAAGAAPILVHVILDEHIGVEGLPADDPEAAAARKALTAYFADNGFALFGGAYNEYMHTINAIPFLLNFGVQQPWHPESKDDGVRVARNAYFDRLRALGYAISVYQSDFVDFCTGQQLRACNEQRAAGLEPIATSDLPTADKAQLILYGFWSLSDAVVTASTLYDVCALLLQRAGLGAPVIDIDLYSRTSTAVALDLADQLVADLRGARPGEAYFAHLLLPHYPYAARDDCTLERLADWRERRSAVHDIAERQDAYFEQLGCVQTKVAEILAALDGRPSIVLLHGDHGSRITQHDPTVENEGEYGDADLIAGFSTLFAVRAPGLAPGYDAARLPVAKLLESLANSGFRSAAVELPAGFVPSVVLEDAYWRPIERHELPRAWTRP